MSENDKAVWDGEKLTMLARYDWPEAHEKLLHSTKINPQSPDCSYWVAVDGVCFGMTGNDTTCIANIETMLLSASGERGRAVYVTFALKDRSAGQWRRWSAKWAKRTTGHIPAFDASVRTVA